MKQLIAIFQLIAMLLQNGTAVGYEKIEVSIHGYRQVIHKLEVELSEGIEVHGGLSHNSVFGFEPIGSILEKNQAIAGVNGMFFDDLGSPAGLLCEKGQWIRISDIQTPSLVIDKQASIQQISVKATWHSATEKGDIYSYNVGAFLGLINVFTDSYAETNRLYRKQVTYRIRNGQVIERYLTDSPVSIGKDMLVSCLLPEEAEITDKLWQNLPAGIPLFQIGDSFRVEFEVIDEQGRRITPTSVYQSGGRLVKAGKNVAKSKEDFIGYTISLQPRTVVAIDKKGRLCFYVVEGRQKQVAEGLSGEWLAEFLVSQNIEEAAYMDGGASSVMALQGGLISRPAYPDTVQAKEIAHAILIRRGVLLDNRKR